MATGIPKRKKQHKKKENYNLTYPNKISEENIFSGEKDRHILIKQWGTSSLTEVINSLYWGDNLATLRSLLEDKSIKGKIRLVYIDPPFATQSIFHSRQLKHAYDDILTDTEYIEFLRQRLIIIRELMATDGSIYIHLDEKMVFEMKIILDEIFGKTNFQNCITRKKCNPKNYTRKRFGNISDYILFYTKSSKFIWNKQFEPLTEDRAKEYQYVEEKTGRRFMKVPIHAPGIRNGETGKPWRNMLPPPGKHWQYTPSKLDELDKRGEIYWSSNGNPRRKVYLDENPGIGVQDIWLDFKDAHNQNIKITGYPTEKNPNLIKRIVEASSNPGDLVLDCFSGSGTTLAVADNLERSWIGIDSSIEAIKTTLLRFKNGTKAMGDFVSHSSKKKESNSKQLSFNLSKGSIQEKQYDYRSITNFRLMASRNIEKQSLNEISVFLNDY
ncbi:MAG: site-specific DNA-methyltransferase [Xenococcaceae cyanobacterium MO_167.B27]|nr:site-specific DNA-methyltransferase [Xenococcaceae cyanobacterium MO_167.B27]